MTQVLILSNSLYGHVHRMALAVAEGVREIPGCEPVLRRVPENLPLEVLDNMGAAEFQREFATIPVVTMDELAGADGVILGTPTRFGNMCGQMRQFLDATGKLWGAGALVGTVGSVFTSSATQHGGQESTILSFHITLLHHGMVLAGLPYSFEGQSRLDEITGGRAPTGNRSSPVTGRQPGSRAKTSFPRRGIRGGTWRRSRGSSSRSE